MNFSAVIFDKDGVIIDTQPIHYQVFKGFCHEFDWDISEDQYESYIGMTCSDLFFEIKQLFQAPYTVSELVERFQKRYLQAIDASPGIEPIKGVVPLIERLHKEGIQLALASSANGITTANAANMYSIGYQNPLGKQNLKHADLIVDDFSVLNESYFIVSNSN